MILYLNITSIFAQVLPEPAIATPQARKLQIRAGISAICRH